MSFLWSDSSVHSNKFCLFPFFCWTAFLTLHLLLNGNFFLSSYCHSQIRCSQSVPEPSASWTRWLQSLHRWDREDVLRVAAELVLEAATDAWSVAGMLTDVYCFLIFTAPSTAAVELLSSAARSDTANAWSWIFRGSHWQIAQAEYPALLFPNVAVWFHSAINNLPNLSFVLFSFFWGGGRWFPGVWILRVDVSEHSVISIFMGGVRRQNNWAKPSQRANWRRRLARSATRRPSVRSAIPAFDRIAWLCNKHLNL